MDKPAGMTSHDVVDHVRRRFHTRKVGHGGTLDPDATGVLVIGIGRGTRLLSYAQAAPKRYSATARLGVTTTTQDASGDVVEERPVAVEGSEVAAVLGEFTGSLEQVPPMVSAVKVGGERLYKKAFRGEEVERAARPVTIFALDLIAFEPGPRPQMRLDVRCSGGTYVRTLVHDIGELLGCGAHLVSLRRTEAGGFTLADTHPLDALDHVHLRPLVDALGDLPRVDVDEATAVSVSHGRPLDEPPDGAALDPGRSVALVRAGELLAVYRVEGRRLVADRVLGR